MTVTPKAVGAAGISFVAGFVLCYFVFRPSQPQPRTALVAGPPATVRGLGQPALILRDAGRTTAPSFQLSTNIILPRMLPAAPALPPTVIISSPMRVYQRSYSMDLIDFRFKPDFTVEAPK